MFDIAKLQPLLTSILGESKKYSKNEFYFFCPICQHHKPKLAINLGTGQWHCWKCGISGKYLISLLKKLSVSRDQISQLKSILNDEIPYVRNEKTSITLKLPDEYIPMWNVQKTPKYRHALIYLKNRGITIEDVFKYRIGYCESGLYADRIIIPSFDASGNLNFFSSRAFFENMTPHKNPPVSKNIIGFENLISWKFPITLVEGAFDAIAVKRNAIPLFGKSMSSKLRQTIIDKSIAEVNIAIDPDARYDAILMAKDLMDQNINVRLLQYEGKDPSEIGFEKFNQIIQNTSFLNFSDLIELKIEENYAKRNTR
jgi:DNA primase